MRDLKTYKKSVLLMVATIIGAGVFGLPHLFARIGFWPATILFACVLALVALTHNFFVTLALDTPHKMRLPGHAHRVLGPIGGMVATVTYPLQMIGANVAYVLLGGTFLQMLVREAGLYAIDGIHLWQLIFVACGGITVFFGLRAVTHVESYVTWGLIASMIVLSALVLARVDATAVASFTTRWSPSLFPFGVFLFSLSGLPAVGEAVENVGRNPGRSRKSVFWGTMIAGAVSYVFAVAFALTITSASSSDPLMALQEQVPVFMRWLIPLAGFLAVATSYIATAQDLKATVHLDFGVPKLVAWMVAMCVPYAITLWITPNFLIVIGVIGAVFGGINGMMLALLMMRSHRERALPATVGAAYAIGILQKLL